MGMGVVVKLKTLQWNIGGAKIRRKEADPTLAASYQEEGFDYIAALIQKYQPDIITLQETHATKGSSQVEQLSTLTGLPYWHNDIYAESHLEEGQKLGLGILSR